MTGRTHQIVTFATAAAIIANVWFLFSIRAASERLEAVTYTALADRPVPAEAAAPILGTDLTGASVAVMPQDHSGDILLYAFSPSCRWCDANHKSFEALLEQLGPDIMPLAVSISAQGVPEYLASRPTRATVIVSPEPVTVNGYKLRATPMTYLIRKGIIEQVWSGAYSGPALREIQQAFGVTIPDANPSGS